MRVLALLIPLLCAGAARAEQPLLRGPHPFRSDNAVAVAGGYGMANFFSGVRLGASYGFQAAGSLWIDIRLDLLDGQLGPSVVNPKCAQPCGRMGSFVDVMAGFTYRLRMNVPVVPYAGVTAGPVYLFPEGADNAFGIAARGVVGARYYFYEWLGLGLEIGGLVGGAWVDDVPGLESDLRILDLVLGAELQF